MQDSDILAVIVKIIITEKYFQRVFTNWENKRNDKILDFNRNDIYQNNLLSKKFSYTKVDLVNESDIKIATLNYTFLIKI